MLLLQPLTIGARSSKNSLMFGPHATNLGDDLRGLSPRHVAYYERRSMGGCGIIVVEGASVHDSDWPYERAPLATQCVTGWTAISDACHAHGSLVIASLDHAGGQGSSAYSQLPLWAPSRVPEVNSREVPKWMEIHDINAVIEGFFIIQQLRLRNQRTGTAPGGENRINPDKLNELDRHMLKEAFKQAKRLQSRLQLEYRL